MGGLLHASPALKLVRYGVRVVGECSSLVCPTPKDYPSRVGCRMRSRSLNSGGRRFGGIRGGRVSSGFSEDSIAAEELKEEAGVSTSGASVHSEYVGVQVLERVKGGLRSEGLLMYKVALALPGFFLPLELEGAQSVVEALVVLGTIVIVHETGHFLAARVQGIHVTQFAIGFGPVILRFSGQNVEYSLRAIPLGGYVAFPDDDPEALYQPDDPNLLKNRSIPERALVISAGVIANLIFAYSVLVGQSLTVGLVEQEFLPGVVIPEVVPNSAAALAGIHPGDVITGVNGHLLDSTETSVFDLEDTIRESAQKKLNLLMIRGAELWYLDVTPDDAGEIEGLQLSTNSISHRVKAGNAAEAIVKAAEEFSKLLTIVTDGLKQLFYNFTQTAEKLAGPVAIVAVGAEVARNDDTGLFQFAAIVNINLAVVNLLPLPSLDGGYLFLIALEALRGKKLPDGVEQGIVSSGIVLLLALGVVLMVRDTLNLDIVQQIL